MTAEFDFDTPVDRHATGSYKWDSIGRPGGDTSLGRRHGFPHSTGHNRGTEKAR